MIAVVIPCYKVKRQILKVIKQLGPDIDLIFVIDDKCPEETGKYVLSACKDTRVKVLFHDRNKGVGAAMITGYKAALEAKAEIIVKIDGDDQMDTKYLPQLLIPLIKRDADYVKGNRFFNLKILKLMPFIRRLGNSLLSLLVKAISGYWNISDPTNGYTAISSHALSMINLDKLSKGYFFETSMLIYLNTIRSVIVDMPVPAKYGDEKSSMSIGWVLFSFPFKLFLGLLKRIYWRYFIYEINAVSIFLITGLFLISSGSAFGIYRWYIGFITNQIQTVGTVFFAALPLILGFQMVLQAVVLDIQDKPSVSLNKTYSEIQGKLGEKDKGPHLYLTSETGKDLVIAGENAGICCSS